MKLREILQGYVDLEGKQYAEATELEVTGITLDSRAVKPNYLFVALAGSKQHGLSHLKEAIEKGACAVLFDTAGEDQQLATLTAEIPLIPFENLGGAIGQLGSRFYGEPTKTLRIIGITGTNGKTSCSQFIAQLLEDCGIIGTLGWGEWGQLNETINTTPDALTIQQIMADFVAMKKSSVAMEVSSHGLHQGRVNGVTFSGAVFTNITRDHLDYHGTMEEYLAAKLRLLQMPDLKFVVVNLDDAFSQHVIEHIPNSVALWGISTKGNRAEGGQTLPASNIQHTLDGFEFDVVWKGVINTIKAPLYGDFNVENLLCVLAVLLAMEQPLDKLIAKLAGLKSVPGRMERCVNQRNDVYVFIDYAHTPDALNRVLASVRKHCEGTLWVIFGCGGNRDAGKRPQMGRFAEEWADRVIITDDNPRFENNAAIVEAILNGCQTDKPLVILDRRLAIEFAIEHALPGDFIVIAGKGHENYQEINGIQYPFNDKAIAEYALNERVRLQ